MDNSERITALELQVRRWTDIADPMRAPVKFVLLEHNATAEQEQLTLRADARV